ncbi:MAG: hypothetical protein ABIF77_02030 [bacterium]
MITQPNSRLLCCLSILVLLPLLSGTASAGEEQIIDGVTHIVNSATPSQGLQTMQLEELWRVGGEASDMFFGLITQVRHDEAGNIYLLDSQLSEVQVYSPAGDHLQTLFREGEGPGEIRQARDLIMMPDGAVGAVMEYPAKVIQVDRDNNPVGELTVGADDLDSGGSESLICGDSGGGSIVLTGAHATRGEDPGISERINFLSRYGSDGAEEVRYLESHSQYNFNDFVFTELHHMPNFWWCWDVGPDGRVYATPYQDRYEIHVFLPDGTPDRVIEREYQSRPRTSEEYDRFEAMVENAMSGMGIPVTVEVEKNDPDVAQIERGIRVRDDGTLWVLHSHGMRDQPDGIMLTFDVFDPAGHYLKQVAVACDADPAHDGIFFTGGGRAVVVKEYIAAMAAQFGRGSTLSEEGVEAQAMEVICFRIVE